MANSRHIRYIYLVRFFSYFVQAIFLPFYAVWLLDENLLTIAQAASVVSLGIFTIRLAALPFTPLIHRYAKKYIILICLLGLLACYLWMWLLSQYQVESFAAWCAVTIMLGMFISILSLTIMTATALQLHEDHHTKGFSWINIMVNLSAGIGPFVGSLILYYYRNALPLAPILFILISFALALKIPPDKTVHNHSTEKTPVFSWGNRLFWFFMAINFCTIFAYAQFYDVFPLYAKPYIGERLIGTLFLISGIIVVLLQAFITRWFAKVNANQTILIGNLLAALGTGLYIGAQYHLISLCILAVLITVIAELIYGPLYQSLAIKLYPTKSSVHALALLNFTWGLAESAATFLGIFLVGHGIGMVSYLLAVAITLLAIFLLFFKRLPIAT